MHRKQAKYRLRKKLRTAPGVWDWSRDKHGKLRFTYTKSLVCKPHVRRLP